MARPRTLQHTISAVTIAELDKQANEFRKNHFCTASQLVITQGIFIQVIMYEEQ